MQYFRERILNQRPWFRIDIGTQTIEGKKAADGQLELTFKFMGQFFLLKLNRENADKLSGWMSRNYPTRGMNNVVPFSKLKAIDSGTPERDM